MTQQEKNMAQKKDLFWKGMLFKSECLFLPPPPLKKKKLNKK